MKNGSILQQSTQQVGLGLRDSQLGEVQPEQGHPAPVALPLEGYNLLRHELKVLSILRERGGDNISRIMRNARLGAQAGYSAIESLEARGMVKVTDVTRCRWVELSPRGLIVLRKWHGFLTAYYGGDPE